MVDTREASPCERSCVIWQAVSAQTCKNSKRQIEQAYESSRREAHWTLRNPEVGDQPASLWSESHRESVGERVNLVLSEAIKEKMRRDEVIAVTGRSGKIAERVFPVRLQPQLGV